MITVHGAQKTCGSLLAALDVHPRVAVQILRHSKIALTMEIYTEVSSAVTRDAQEARKLAGQLASLGVLEQAGCLVHSSAWSGGKLASGPRGHDALEKCLAAHEAAGIRWDQIGRAPYDRAHAEL